MRFRYLAAFLAVLLVVVPAAAQEQRGSIEGSVKDAQGDAVAGTVVSATSANGLSVETISGANGRYRFPSLLPGTYTITANIAGFKPAKVENVTVSLGEIRTVTLTLALGGVEEIVEVTGVAPLIDVRQSARGTNFREEAILKMPKGRDYTSIVTQAPGVNLEASKFGTGGPSIDGAAPGENRYIIDGAETTELRSGTSGKVLITDFLDEVQVKSSGYTAEYGGATGGVINAVTRSGTNTWHGDLYSYFSGDALSSDPRRSLRLVPTNSKAAEYVTYPEDGETRWEPGALIGGPIVRDKVWFFGGYNPELTSTDRTVTARADGVSRTSDQTFKRHNLTGNITAQLDAKTRTRATFTSSGYRQEGRLPSLDGTTSPSANLAIDDVNTNYSASVGVDFTPSSKVFLSGRGGWYRWNLRNAGVFTGTRYLFSSSNVGLAGVPANLQGAVGTTNVPTNSSTTRDARERLNAQFDVTYFASVGGEHEFKAGVQLDRIANNVLTGEQGNLVRIQWDRSLDPADPTTRGTLGYYQVRSNGVEPQKGFLTVGNIHQNNIGFFIQDAWTIKRRFTLNLGVRTENEHIPSFADASYGLPDVAIKFQFADKLQPRAGFAYDLKGDGRWKVYGSWGIFYDITKLELPRGSFGGDKWLEYYYSLDTPDWPNLDTTGCPPACPGRLLRGPIDFRHPSFGSDTLDPDIRPYRSQEAVAGLDHELTQHLSVGVRYVHKQLDRVVEDTGSLDAQQNEIYVIGNPSEGMLATAFVLADGTKVPLPKPKRTYDAVELTVNKRMANRWSGRFSYLWSRLYGNHTGLGQSDENARTSPNVGRVYDYPIMMFDGSGRPLYGLLPTDRPHTLKAQVVYDAPFGTSFGLNWYAFSGIPRTREVGVIPPNNFPVAYAGRNSDGRLPFFNQADLYLQHEFRLSNRTRLTLSANVINLLDQDTTTNYHSGQLASGGLNFTEQAFYTGQVDVAALAAAVPQDPRFLQANGFQGQRSIRLGARLSF